MKIEDKLIHPYFIEVENDNNHVVKKHYTNKKGNPSSSSIGYFPNVGFALSSIVKLIAGDTNSTLTISKYVDRLEEAVAKVKSLKQVK